MISKDQKKHLAIEIKHLKGMIVSKALNGDVQMYVEDVEIENDNTLLITAVYKRKFTQLVIRKETPNGTITCGWNKENKSNGINVSIEVSLFDDEFTHFPRVTIDGKCGEQRERATLGVVDGVVSYLSEEDAYYNSSLFCMHTYHDGTYGKAYTDSFDMLTEMIRIIFQETIDLFEEW